MSTSSPQPVTVGLVQINNSFSGQNYLPYSVGVLQVYAEANSVDPDRYTFIPAIYKRIPISDIVSQLKEADVIGFSTYVWNHEISLEAAKRLKALNDDVLIVFGGPHVPDSSEEWLRKNSFVDVAVHGEGEATFLEVLESYPRCEWHSIAGLSFISDSGKYVKTNPRERFRTLDDVPSPFLEGTFEPLMAAHSDEAWIGLWETNRGCPFRCTFCDWGSATAAKVTKFGLDRLYAEVDWFAEKKIEYIFCCDANFGIQKRDLDIANYVAQVKSEKNFPSALSVQNTKNATERAYETQKALSDAGLNKGVALSMQSLDMTTLKSVKRDNISGETYRELQRRFTRDRIETYSDLIIGLPGETYSTFVAGVSDLIETGQHNRIQFNNLSILPNAEMGNPDYQKEHGMKTVRSEIINFHGERITLEDDVPEYQDLVIATSSMPPDAWRKTRAFSWMTAFLHFDKILQIPLIVTHEFTSCEYGKLIESFLNANPKAYPLIAEISGFFMSEAEAIQRGGSEYVFSADYLGIYWPADEFMFIKLTESGQLPQLYSEAEKLLLSWLSKNADSHSETILCESLRLNFALLKQPFVGRDITLDLEFDVPSFYQNIRLGQRQNIEPKAISITIERSKSYYDDFQKWCREVVWWGNKKGAYLYTNSVAERQLAGHF